jgi:hypothetical protein
VAVSVGVGGFVELLVGVIVVVELELVLVLVLDVIEVGVGLGGVVDSGPPVLHFKGHDKRGHKTRLTHCHGSSHIEGITCLMMSVR